MREEEASCFAHPILEAPWPLPRNRFRREVCVGVGDAVAAKILPRHHRRGRLRCCLPLSPPPGPKSPWVREVVEIDEFAGRKSAEAIGEDEGDALDAVAWVEKRAEEC